MEQTDIQSSNDDKLIQIIGYRKGVDPKTGNPYLWQKHFDLIAVTSVVSLFNNLDAIVNLIPENERYDVHFTVANCHKPSKDKEKKVPLRLFAYQEAIPIDLDGIDLSKRLEYMEIVERVLKIDLKKTAISISGHGMHFVIALDHVIETGEELHKLQAHYKAVCGMLTQEFFNNGLAGEADPVRLAESATLRLPNTMNCKYPDNPVKAELLNGNIEPQPFYIDSFVNIEEEEQVASTARNVDTKAVLAGCEFLKHTYNNPTQVTEPQWYAMLGVLSFIPETGKNLCHTYSNKHPDYSFEETDTKSDQALGFGKPRTCDSIGQVFSGCMSCPYYKKVKTPLAIKGDDYVGTKDTGFHYIIDGKRIPDYEGLVKYFGQQTTYVVDKVSKQLHGFNGKFWEEVTPTELEEFANKHFNPIANNNKRSEFKGLLLSTNVVSPDFFGKDNGGYINFNNGVLRIVDRVLLPHSAEFGFNYSLPYDYNPNAICPTFDKMMENVTLSDPQMTQLLLEYIGYAISGLRANYGAKALILTGGGSNGKSTFLNVIKELVGRSCYSAVSLVDMAKENHRYAMVGKLFNICEEAEEDELRKGTAVFKSIVTGAEMMVKKLYSDVVPMRIDAKLILSCNELPSSKENTYAIYRRMLIVPFRANFTGKDIDKSMEGKIRNEMSGIYNKVLNAYSKFVENNYTFSESEAVNKALDEYRYSNSIYNQFVDSCLAKGTVDDFLSVEEIVEMYNTWAQANNMNYRPSGNKLCKELKVMGVIVSESSLVKVGGKTRRGYRGLKKLNQEKF